MGPPALLPIRSKACYGFVWLLKIHASAGFEPATLGVQLQAHKPLHHRGDGLTALEISITTYSIRSRVAQSV
jgi:hypothetical protein